MAALEISEIVRNYALVLAGTLGLLIAVWRAVAAARQASAARSEAAIARRDHFTEVFGRAVGLLSDNKLEIRLGAIYLMRPVMRDEVGFIAAGRHVLQSYLEARGSEPAYQSNAPDIQVIQKILDEFRKGKPK